MIFIGVGLKGMQQIQMNPLQFSVAFSTVGLPPGKL